MNEEPRVVGKTLELTALREDGSEFPIGLTIGTWTIGERRYFTGVIRDITDRKEAEKALSEQFALLEESRSELKLALDQLESVNSVILRWNPKGLITGLNSFGQELFGFTESEVLDQHLVGTIIPKGGGVDDDLRGMIDDILAQPENYLENENQNIRKDGSAFWMMWRNKPITAEDGSLEEIVSIGIDITRRKELERELAIANKRMGDELNIGREIQMSMIPLKFPPFPDHDEFSIYAALEPAREVGGDFYDYYFLDEEQFCFCIGDVSGKGVPAALFMAMAKTLIKSRAADDRSTASIITHVNDELSENNKSCMFVTLFAGILNVQTGELLYTNAGHNPPYIRRRDGTLQPLDQRHGPAVAAMEGMVYKEERESLEPGDLLFLYTDGVTEAMDVDHHLFSDDRLKDLLASLETNDADTAVDHAMSAVRAFEGEAEQADDITVLGLRYQGKPEDALRAE
jgi:PAS domain S-box-containing protein